MKLWDKLWDGYTMVEMAQRLTSPTRLVVDVGCGIQPCRVIRAERYVAVEPHAGYHEKALAAVTWPLTILHGSWKDKRDEVIALAPSVIIALDVIEHMERADGEAFRRDLEDIPSEAAVVFTPHGFKEQSYKEGQPDAWGMDGQFWQTHRSGWMPEDFLGWHIVLGRGQVTEGVWEHTIMAIYDKVGVLDRPEAMGLLGEGVER